MSRLSATVRRVWGEWAGRTHGRSETAWLQPRTAIDGGPLRVSGRVQCIQLVGYRMYVDLTDELVGAAIAGGHYEPHVTRALSSTLRPGDTFVDLGANIGYYSLLAAAIVGPGGQVIGFEARPDNVWLAQLSVRENGFRNVTLHNLAVADRATQLKMHAPDHTSLSKVVDEAGEIAGNFVAIPAVALDDALADLTRVDVVKMDIDGGEVRALRGMRGLLERHRPKLFFEYAPFTLQELGRCAPRTLLEEVMALGYRLHAVPRLGSLIPLETVDQIVAYQASLGSPQAHIDLFGACD